MKLKKFIIISSSLIGAIATALGIITVFYPDILNLEKKTIASFSMEAYTETDAQNFYDFLDKNRNEIVKLDISVCSSTPMDSKCPKIIKNNNSLTFDFHETDSNGNIICESSNFSEGISFYFNNHDSFDDSDISSSIWSWEKLDDCSKVDDFGLFVISQYFLVPEKEGYGQGWIEWHLIPVDAMDIKLKDY